MKLRGLFTGWVIVMAFLVDGGTCEDLLWQVYDELCACATPNHGELSTCMGRLSVCSSYWSYGMLYRR